jgi:hypothetical protein
MIKQEEINDVEFFKTARTIRKAKNGETLFSPEKEHARSINVPI